ncbi:MAG: hypothetical protein ABIR55_00340 [Burkholderiaceae bacterium]
MALRASSKSIDVQKVVSGAAKLELKLLNAGVEAMQVYLNQAGRLSDLAGDTLQAIQDDKATLADTALKLTDFGRQNVKAYADLSQRLGALYYDELDRLAGSALKREKPVADRGVKVALRAKVTPAKATRRAKRKVATA